MAAGLTTGSWLKQEAGHGWLSVEPFDLQTESCRPVYCIFPPMCWIKFDKRCFSLVTRETASANREEQREEEPRGACIDYKSGSRLSALCWSMQSRSERELSKQTREWKKKTGRQSYHTLPAWVRTGHPCWGIFSWDLWRENTLMLMLRERWRGDTLWEGQTLEQPGCLNG